MKIGDDVGSEKASCVEDMACPFLELDEPADEKRLESQPMAAVDSEDGQDEDDARVPLVVSVVVLVPCAPLDPRRWHSSACLRKLLFQAETVKLPLATVIPDSKRCW